MKITFFNVGYGEAIWVECLVPGQADKVFHLLIDGGSGMEAEYEDRSTGRLSLIEHLERIGADHIDGIILTHIHEDHVGGLIPVVQRFTPRHLWQLFAPELHKNLPSLPEFAIKDPDRARFYGAIQQWRRLLEMIEDQGGQIHGVKAYDALTPCPNLRLQILSPSAQQACAAAERMENLFSEQESEAFLGKLTALDRDMNRFSLMIRLEWFGHRVLLSADADKHVYRDIPREQIQADVFQIGHHGQADGADEALLETIDPHILICCASSDRRYGSADPELLLLAHRMGAEICCSDCPPMPRGIAPIPPHHALVLELCEDKSIRVSYQGMEGVCMDEGL